MATPRFMNVSLSPTLVPVLSIECEVPPMSSPSVEIEQGQGKLLSLPRVRRHPVKKNAETDAL